MMSVKFKKSDIFKKRFIRNYNVYFEKNFFDDK